MITYLRLGYFAVDMIKGFTKKILFSSANFHMIFIFIGENQM